MKYTTKTLVEQYLSKTISDDIDRYIEAMSRHLDKMCDRTLMVDTTETATVKKYDGNGTPRLIVDDFVALTSMVVSGTTIAPASYVSEPVNKAHSNYIIITSGQNFGRDRQNVVLTGHFGLFPYEDGVTEREADIEHACTVLVAGIVQNSDNPEGIVRSESIGRYNVTYTTDKQSKDFDFAMSTVKMHRRESF